MASLSHRFSSFYGRALASQVLSILVVALAVWLWGTRALERRVVSQLTESLIRDARFIEPEVRSVLLRSPEIAAVQPLVERYGKQTECRITVISPEGTVLGDSEHTETETRTLENHRDRPEVDAALSGNVGTALRYSATMKFPMLYVAIPVWGEKSPRGVLRVAVPAAEVWHLRREVRWFMGFSIGVGILGATMMGAWLMWGVTNPLRKLTRQAKAYAEGNFHQKALDSSIREVRELSESLVAMAQAISAHLAELAAERNQVTSILESMAEGVIALDAQGRILVMNPAARHLLGVETTPVPHQYFSETVRHHPAQEVLRDVLLKGTPIHAEVVTGSSRVLRFHGIPCPGREGLHAILVVQDMTESHRHEQLRKEFVANVSHELKSPLASIRSLTETLLNGALYDSQYNRRFLEMIDEDAARLNQLIDDLLTLSFVESNAVPIQRTCVEVGALVQSVVAAFAEGIEKRRLTVTVDVPVDLRVQADPDRLWEVLSNLIDNAVKYNKEGGSVTISARRIEEGVRITVSDTGIGIPEKDLPRIFERFYRVDKARSRALGGTGLGLAIVKHIVEAHGGTLSVESKVNSGSSFSFTLPAGD